MDVRRIRVCRRAATVIVLAAVWAPAAHAAEPAPVTGTLSAPGYTVMALTADGRASTVVARRSSFRLRPRARTVTLHLRAPNGVYAGPVVVRGGGDLVLLGVRAGARLGRIAVRRGYARPTRTVRRSWIDASRAARARGGVPIGARNFGRVRSVPPRTGRVPGDRDRDGIPDPLDIDDDGDRILDDIDRARTARTAQTAPGTFAFEFGVGADLFETANVNAAGLTVAQSDALLVRSANLTFDVLPGDSSELDCGTPQSRTDPALGGLGYCTRGGTGVRVTPGTRTGVPFPACCDEDGDGFGTLSRNTLLLPRATSAQIGSGDVLIQRVRRDGVETQYAATLQYVFATVPALVSYDDGRGHAAPVTYPVAGANCGAPPCPPPGPGTIENPFPVSARSDGDIVVTLTFWRAQRRALPGESGDWTDLGRLIYDVEAGDTGRDCPQGALSTKEPRLSPAPMLETGEGEDPSGGLFDATADRPADPRNTLTVTVNLSACLRARRQEFPTAETWSAGEAKSVSIRATDRTSFASQTIRFRREG